MVEAGVPSGPLRQSLGYLLSSESALRVGTAVRPCLRRGQKVVLQLQAPVVGAVALVGEEALSPDQPGEPAEELHFLIGQSKPC